MAELPAVGVPQNVIGVRQLVTFYITSLIGAGILLVPTVTADLAGPASLLAWVALAIAAYPFALMFALMSAQWPDSAGLAALMRRGHGGQAGDTASLALVVVYVVGNPIMGLTSARYFLHLVDWPSGALLPTAAAFMALSVGFTAIGLRVGAWLQTALLVVLSTGLGLAVLLALPYMRVERFTPFVPHGWSAVGLAAVVAFYSFLGWENVSALAEEVRDPARSYRRAVRIAVPIIAVFNIVVAAALLAVPQRADAGVLTSLLQAPFGQPGAVFGDVLAIGIIVVATNAWVLGASRLVSAAARDGLLPRSLASRSVNREVPSRALIALVGCYAALLLLLHVVDGTEQSLLTLTSSVFLLLYVGTASAALRVDVVPGLRACAAVTLAITIGFLSFAGFALLAAGLVVAFCALVAAIVRSPRWGGPIKPPTVTHETVRAPADEERTR